MVPAGTLSVIVTVAASDGPKFVAVSVYVSSAPGATGSGAAVLTRRTSADGFVVVTWTGPNEVLWFGEVDASVALLLIWVLLATEELTVTM